MSYDFSRITERLFCGSQINTVADITELRAAGVTHIIDCCEAGDGAIVDQFNRGDVALLWNPTADDGTHKGTDWFSHAVDFAAGALAHPGYIVHCHCQAGINRGPSIAYAIMRSQGMPASLALGWLHTARPVTVVGVRYAADAEVALAQLGWT